MPSDEDSLPFQDRVETTDGTDWHSPEQFFMYNIQMPPADVFLFASGVPMLSRLAATELADLLTDGLMLPINCSGGDYVAYRPPMLAGVLDLERSVMDYNEEFGYASSVEHWEFKPEALADLTFFRLYEAWGFFGTERFMTRLKERDLTRGIVFEELWPNPAPGTYPQQLVF